MRSFSWGAAFNRCETPDSYDAALLRVPLSKLGRFVFLLPNTPSCFIHCNGSRFLVLIAKVSSRRHQPSSPKRIHLLSPNPDQLVGFNRKASLKECSHGKSCNPKSDDTCNFHDLSSEAGCPYIDWNPDDSENPYRVRREGTFLWYSANTEALQELLGFLYAECCTRNNAIEQRKIVSA